MGYQDTNNSSNTNSYQIATFTTSAPCSYHRGHALSIYGLTLMHDGGRLLFQAAGTNSTNDSSTMISLPHGSITGLVGTNGAGKSSLAQVLASQALDGFPYDQLTVEYLAAADDEDGHSDNNNDNTDMDSLSRKPREYIQLRIQARLDVIRQTIEQLECRLTEDNDAENDVTAAASVEEISEQLTVLYDVEESMVESMERETDRAMERVGLKVHAHKTLAQLSCGWRYKCRLIASTLSHPQCFIVDEPSFLDTKSTEWLVEKLQNMARNENTMVLLISHKEALLETLCDRIWYINSANQTLTTYNGSYSSFRSNLELELQHMNKTVEETEDRFQSADKSLKKIQSVCKKREQNFKAQRLEMFTDKRWIKGKNKEAKQRADRSAASKLKKAQHAVDEAQEIKHKAKRERVKPLEIHGMPAEGVILSLQSVGFRYEEDDDTDWLFQNVDTVMEANDRVLLQGPNGCGKTSLVQLILGKLEPGEGSVHRTTQNVVYFPQTALHRLLRDYGHQTAMEFLLQNEDDNDDCVDTPSSNSTIKTETQLRQHLAEFGLAKELALHLVHTLSAGQRVRLWLAKELLKHPRPALLILDEMSENVDVETRKSLVEMLQLFEGAVLAISHDPDFCTSFKHQKTWSLWRYGMEVTYSE